MIHVGPFQLKIFCDFSLSYYSAWQKSPGQTPCLPMKQWAGLMAWFWKWDTGRDFLGPFAMELGFQLGFLVFVMCCLGAKWANKTGEVIGLISDQVLWKVLYSENRSFWKAHK